MELFTCTLWDILIFLFLSILGFFIYFIKKGWSWPTKLISCFSRGLADLPVVVESVVSEFRMLTGPATY